MPMVRTLLCGRPVISERAWESSGVAREKVVAVPASSPTMAMMSTNLPGQRSTHFPRTGRQASLIRWTGFFLTWSR